MIEKLVSVAKMVLYLIYLGWLCHCESFRSSSMLWQGWMRKHGPSSACFKRAGNHPVPVPPAIRSNALIHTAVDNFDKTDNKGVIYYMILVLFEDCADTYLPNNIEINRSPKDLVQVQKLAKVLSCQELVPTNQGLSRGKIPADYKAFGSFTDSYQTSKYVIWVLLRYLATKHLNMMSCHLVLWIVC